MEPLPLRKLPELRVCRRMPLSLDSDFLRSADLRGLDGGVGVLPGIDGSVGS